MINCNKKYFTFIELASGERIKQENTQLDEMAMDFDNYQEENKQEAMINSIGKRVRYQSCEYKASIWVSIKVLT